MQLGGGHVDPGDGFSHGVFHLETWVQLQEAKGVGLGAVEILHSASTCSVVHSNNGVAVVVQGHFVGGQRTGTGIISHGLRWWVRSQSSIFKRFDSPSSS